MNKLILACAVCFGDPNSLMSKGLNAGVLFLVAVVGVVLAAVAVTGFIWSRRSKRMGLSSDHTPYYP